MPLIDLIYKMLGLDDDFDDRFNQTFAKGDKVRFYYFPDVGGVVDHVDEEGQPWVTVDADIMDMNAGDTAPIARHELQKVDEE